MLKCRHKKAYSKVKKLGITEKLASPFGGTPAQLNLASGEDLALNEVDPTMFCLWDCVAESSEWLSKAIQRYNPTEQSVYRYRRNLSEIGAPPATLEDKNRVGFRRLIVDCAESQQEWNAEKLVKEVGKLHRKIADSFISCYDFETFINHKHIQDFLLFIDLPADFNEHEKLSSLLRDRSFILVCDESLYHNYSWGKVYEVGSELIICGTNQDYKERMEVLP